MDNIRYSRLDATDDEVIAAAKAVCARVYHGNGERLPNGGKRAVSFATSINILIFIDNSKISWYN